MPYAGWLVHITFESCPYHFLQVNTILDHFGSKSLLWDQVIVWHHSGSPSMLCGGTENPAGQGGLPSSG